MDNNHKDIDQEVEQLRANSTEVDVEERLLRSSLRKDGASADEVKRQIDTFYFFIVNKGDSPTDARTHVLAIRSDNIAFLEMRNRRD